MSTWHAMTKKPTRRGFYAVEDGWEGSPLYAMFVPETGLWGTPQLTLGKLAKQPSAGEPPTIPCAYEGWRELSQSEAELVASLMTPP